MPLLRGDPFLRLTICGVFQRAFDVFISEPLTFVKIGVIGALPVLFATWLFLAKFMDLLGLEDATDPDETNEKILQIVIGMCGPLLLIFPFVIVASIVLKVATIRSTIQIYVGKQPALSQDLAHGFRLLPRLCCLQFAYICAAFAAGLVIGLVTATLSLVLTTFAGENATAAIVLLVQMCFQAAVMYFSYTFILWDTALVVEGLPEFRPFIRSYELVKGQCCFVFCALMLEGQMFMAIFLLNYGLFGGIGSLAVAIGSAMTGVVMVPYAVIFLTVIYVNSRIKQEEECNSTVLTHEMMLDSEGPESYNTLCSEELQIEAGALANKLSQFENPEETVV